MSNVATAADPAPLAIAPPVAEKRPREFTVGNEVLRDDYFWLREKESPKVTQYLTAENEFTAAVMKPTEAFQAKLFEEMKGRIQQTDLSVPSFDRGYFYYSRTVEGLQYPIVCRKPGSLDAAEQILLDQNELAKGHKYCSIEDATVSDDGQMLAYLIDTTGFREYRLQVKNLKTGETLTDTAEKVSSVAWSADNAVLFYVTDDEAKRPYRLYRHRLGESKDELVYEETDELFRFGVGRTASRKYVIIQIDSLTSSELRYIASDSPSGNWTIFSPREKDHEYDADHRAGGWVIRSNTTSRNFAVFTTPESTTARSAWKPLVPHRETVMIDSVDVFRDWIVVSERDRGLEQLLVIQPSTGEQRRIEFPSEVYSLGGASNPDYETGKYRYTYQTMTTPTGVYEVALKNFETTLLKQTAVLGDFDPKRYVEKRLFATAADGTKIPVSVVSRNETPQDGSAPLLLIGYGAYGIPQSPYFSSARLSLLDRGVRVALAHIRGGGDMGKPWHDAGRMQNKPNTFTDFIAVSEFLIAEKYTSSRGLLIEGHSAGGLLMGAVCNMRPDLFRAAIVGVPFVDVLNTMFDDTLPLTVTEYEEWGNPNIASEYAVMRGYCPYTNLSKQAYPAMLVETSLNDSQVMYWEPAKYVAKLRTLKTDNNRLLLKTNMDAGHGGASGRYDHLKEVAFEYAFLLQEVGIDK